MTDMRAFVLSTLLLCANAAQALTVSNLSPAPGAVVAPTNTIVVTFNTAIDASSFVDKTVRIARRGSDSQFDTADDVIVTPSNIVVSGAQATITLPGPVVDDLYRVTVTSKGGQALQFDGTNDRVTIPGFGQIAPTNEVTIEFWQNVSSVKDQSTFSMQPDQSGNRLQAYVPRGVGDVVWDCGNDNGAGRLTYTPPVSLTGTWNHFALVASQSGNYMRIYRNGVLETQKTGSSVFVQGAYALTLGYNYVGSDWCFGGLIDEFRVWNVARTQAQIQNNMDRTLQGNETGLIGYWDFEEGSGQTVLDRSVSAAHGTLGISSAVASDDPSRVASGADLAGVTAAGVALDGEYTGTLPSGNGSAGGNFVATFRMRTAPTANAQSVSLHAGQSLQITLQGSAIDTAPLTYAIATPPQHGSLAGTGQTRDYTATTGYVGVDSFSFTVHDGYSTSSPATVSISLTNTAPTASAAVLPIQVTIGQAAVFSATASDANSDPLTYSWNFGDGANGSGASTSHAFAARGNYTATVTVSDGFASTPATVPITVINSAPTVSAGVTPAQVKVGVAATFTATGTDADGDALSYIWNFGDGSGGTGASPEHSYAARGQYSVTVTSFDGFVASTPLTIPITVVNSAPTLSAGVAPAVVKAGETAVFTAAGQDADGDGLTFTWNFGDGSVGSGASPSHAFAARGGYTVTVTVSDGVASTVATLPMTVVNTAPTVIAAATSAQINVGQSALFSATGADADGDALSYAWDFGDGSIGTGVALAHTFTSPGRYTAKVVVSDGVANATGAVAIEVVIFALPVNDDADGDGFSDALEAAAGTSSTDPNDTPFDVKLSGTPNSITEVKLAIKLAFGKTDRDALSLSLGFAAPPEFTFEAQPLLIDIGGVAYSFVLNGTGSAAGSAKNGGASIKVTGKPGAEMLRMSLKVVRGNCAAALADEGFIGTAAVKDKELSVTISVLFGGELYTIDQPQLFTAKKDTGSSKNKK